MAGADRQIQTGADRQIHLELLWQVYTNEKNDTNFDAIVQHFLEPHLEHLELSDLKEFPKEIVKRLLIFKRCRHSGLQESHSRRVLNLTKCLSTLARNDENLSLVFPEIRELCIFFSKKKVITQIIRAEFVVFLKRLLDINRPFYTKSEANSSFAAECITKHVIAFISDNLKDSQFEDDLGKNVLSCFSFIVHLLHRSSSKPATESIVAGVGHLNNEIVRCLQTCMNKSEIAHQGVTEGTRYNGLLTFFRRLQPDQGLLSLVILMVIDKNFEHCEKDCKEANIEDMDLLKVLILWLPDIEHISEQLWLANRLYEMTCSSGKNRMLCCNNGIVLTVIQSMCRAVRSATFSKITAGILMNVIEQLGVLSITPSEIKALVEISQLEHVAFSLEVFKKRLFKAFTYITKQQIPGRAFCYFSSLSTKPISGEKPNSGFTVHTWLCVRTSQRSTRRVLYSVQSDSGGGFEAFVDNTGSLYVTLRADSYRHFLHKVPVELADNQWHMLDVVHKQKDGWKVAVYVDGEPLSCSTSVQLSLQGKFSFSIGTFCDDQPTRNLVPPRKHAASSVKSLVKRLSSTLLWTSSVSSAEECLTETSSADLQELFGDLSPFDGEMSSIALFKKPLENCHVTQMHREGANHIEVFCDRDVKSKLVFFLHPKMCRSESGWKISKSNMDSIIAETQTCLNWGITEAFQCIGGFQVLIPLLEDLSWEDGENCLSRFVEFLGSYIENSEENARQLLATNSIPTIGALLQKVDGQLIDKFTLKAVQYALNVSFQQNTALYDSILQHVLMDFSIWNASQSWEVKFDHAQYVNSVIKMGSTHTRPDFKSRFGVQFILDVIRQFYCQDGYENPAKSIRDELFDIIKFYLQVNIVKEEVQSILFFIHSTPDNVMLKALELLQELLTLDQNGSLHISLSESDNSCFLYPILAGSSTTLEKAQLLVGEIIRMLLVSTQSSKKGENYWIMKGLIGQLRSPSERLTRAVFDIIEESGEQEAVSNFLLMGALAGQASLDSKLYISFKLLQKLQSSINFAAKLVQAGGWQKCLSHFFTETMGDFQRPEPKLGENLEDIYRVLMWKDVGGTFKENWKERLMVFHSLKQNQGLQHMYVRPIEYSRWLLESMLKKCSTVLLDSATEDLVALQNARQLIELVFDFIQTYESNRDNCFSPQLLHLVTDLLNQMSIWKNCNSCPGLSKVGLFILLKFVCNGNERASSQASKILIQLVTCHQLEVDDEINYCIFNLQKAFQTPSLRENHPQIIAVLKVILEHNRDLLELGKVFKHQRASLNVDSDFLNSCVWINYVEGTVNERQRFCVRKLKELKEELQDLWNEVNMDYSSNSQKYLRQTELSIMRFDAEIIAILNKKKEAEMQRFSTTKNLHAISSEDTLEEWSCRKRFLSRLGKSSQENQDGANTGLTQNGQSSNHEIVDWKLSPLENYKRMRIKVVPSDCCNGVLDYDRTSGLPDDHFTQDGLKLDTSPTAATGEEESSWYTVTDIPKTAPARANSVKEELPYQMSCERVFIWSSWPGQLEISINSLSFWVNDTENQKGKNFTMPLRMLRNIHCRMRNHQPIAVEIFLRDRTNCFISFDSETMRERFLREVERVKGTDSNFKIFSSPPAVFTDSNCMTQWQTREISNFDYLMQLNTIAGRTYNDSSQYPIFPRVFKDYADCSTKTLNLADPTIYRSFTQRAENARYDGVYWTEFTMEQAFSSTRTSSCNELAPDFFCNPDFFVNNGRVNLGRPRGRVFFPAWTEQFPDKEADEEFLRANDFVWKHRMALESDFVSSQLHHWIDLIFGCNQQEILERPGEKNRLQLPAKLLTRPHPVRWTKEICHARQILRGKPLSILDYFGDLTNAKVDSIIVYEKPNSGNLISVNIASLFFTIVGFDNLVTITDEGFVGLHKWQGVKNGNVFDFRFECGYPPDSSRCKLIEPLCDNEKLQNSLVAVSADAEKVFVGGYWDGTLRIHQINPAVGHTRIRRLQAHHGVVSCLHLDASGDLLMTGSADTSCKIWRTADLNDRSKPFQCLYRHDDEVTCVSISTEYDMAISGSKDGTVNIHTIGKGLLLRRISVNRELEHSQLVVRQISTSSFGDILFYTEETSVSSIENVVRYLWRYSINGQLLDQLQIGTPNDPYQITTQLLPLQDYLLYGTSQGNLYVRKIHRLRTIDKRRMNWPIQCLTAAYTASQRQYSHILVGLEGTPGLIVVFGPSLLEERT
ncbi:neurobeachin-like protein 1 [Watersipora subatra]|uniref:neurobeachin-like protein 1 n=1 Tax=Watersipora subatra TaxID=2589382 RepID=UPI00355B3F09